ncbi:hypothetical protein [Leptospira yasudae]|uniref:Uncharacterized protein n=1 Tax=Leptospira yasudae TaxID=2202201 RepID=A0ABX9M242_9LEPT|nr:hypothetical protein [Leptospira yasudae]RHX79542.1 hypothetical protein DLM77_11650 [Leptospira yasudae]
MKKILPALLTLTFFFILREGTSYLYQSKEEARVYNTGLYWLTKTDISSKHQSDSFLLPYLLYQLHADLTPTEFARLCNAILIAGILLLIFYFAFEFNVWAGAGYSAPRLFTNRRGRDRSGNTAMQHRLQ